MSNTGIQSVLRRKARTGREEHVARVMTPSRALRLALARAADDLFDLAVLVTSCEVTKASRETALETFRDEQLLLVLDSAEGSLGAVAMDVGVLSGLIEMQTMGKVLPTPTTERPTTQTDAAMVAPLVDELLKQFADNVASSEDEAELSSVVRGMRFGARIESCRMLGLLLEAPDFHVYQLELDLGEGAKQGRMVLVLPESQPVATTEPAVGSHMAAPSPEFEPPRQPCLGTGAFLSAEARIDAVLYRTHRTVAQLGQLKVGDVLVIPRDALSDTRLEVGKAHPIGTSRLGQINGFRAVRLNGTAGLSGTETDMGGDGALMSDMDMPGVEPETMLSDPPALPLAESIERGDINLSPSPDLGDLPEIDLGDLPELELGELPDLPDLPVLPDLPDLPDLPTPGG
ncbi:MAG: hypothetical protein CSA70_10820 [Rhodobacterales bacterium]|nr:MAG: hypothetical protein CSA70_10820 [Rhodobacterales bacterium]